MFRFTDPYKRDSEKIARRIALMLFGEEKNQVFRVPTGAVSWKWQVGQNNDYWLHEEADGVMLFNWRYGNAEREAAYRFMFNQHLYVHLIEEPKRA